MKQHERDDLLIRLDERIHETNKDVKDIKQTLHGNGKIGICDMILNHNTILKNIKWCATVGIPIVIIILGYLFFS